MATVDNIFYLKEGVGGSQSGPGGQITQGEQAIVVFNEPVKTVKQALKDGPFKVGLRHRFDRDLVLSGDIDAEVLDDGTAREWLFSLNYTTELLTASQSREEETYIPVVEPGKWIYSRVVDRDKETGEAFLNPAKDPIDPLPVEQISAPLLRITLKEYSANMQRLNLVGNINNNFIRIAGVDCPKYCVMFDDYIPKAYRDEDGILTFKNTFVMKMKFFKNKGGEEIGFKLETLNQGFNYLDGGTKKEFQVEDDNGDLQPVATPQLLAPDGTPTDTPSYTERNPFDLSDFSIFGLPNNYPIY